MGVKPCILVLLVVLTYTSAFVLRPRRALSEKDILDMFSTSTKTVSNAKNTCWHPQTSKHANWQPAGSMKAPITIADILGSDVGKSFWLAGDRSNRLVPIVLFTRQYFGPWRTTILMVRPRGNSGRPSSEPIFCLYSNLTLLPPKLIFALFSSTEGSYFFRRASNHEYSCPIRHWESVCAHFDQKPGNQSGKLHTGSVFYNHNAWKGIHYCVFNVSFWLNFKWVKKLLYREIDGKMYKAYIKEKQKAKEQYEEAVKKGQSAAHVQQT